MLAAKNSRKRWDAPVPAAATGAGEVVKGEESQILLLTIEESDVGGHDAVRHSVPDRICNPLYECACGTCSEGRSSFRLRADEPIASGTTPGNCDLWAQKYREKDRLFG